MSSFRTWVKRIGIGLAIGSLGASLVVSPAHAATAYTTAAVTLRAGTSTGTTALATVPSGVAINVQCQAKGQSISGTYNSDWWAKVTYAGRTGYLSRAYVRVPAGTSVPTCGTTSTGSPTVVGGQVNLRSGTNTGTTLLATIPVGTRLNIQCQAKGQAIAGTYNSDWWAKVTYAGRTGYASRAYIRVPAGVNVPTCSGSTNPGQSVVGGQISRAEVISRARDWVNRRVPYSMYANTHDRNGRLYRTDCSGFVSMALHLSGSPSTVTLTSYGVHWIPKSSMLPGDLIGNLGPGTGGAAGHVVIFNGWVDSSQTRFYALEQRGGAGAVSSVHTWGASFWSHNAWRYNKIV
ncbi:MAG: C40 family peptidase [Propionibacterium sp.]|nr:C40 family peptidase [Propionibacterium sp.]